MRFLFTVMTLMLLLFAIKPAEAATNDWDYAESYIQYVPGAIFLALDFTDVKAESGFSDRSAEMVVANVVAWGLTHALKRTLDEERPDGSAFNSFPSGHTSTAFACAEVLRGEYGWNIGLTGYACGIYTGTMRVVHNRHWWWDAAAGAVIGIGSAHIAAALKPIMHRYVLKPIFGRWMTVDGGGSISLSPTPVGGAQLSYCLTF